MISPGICPKCSSDDLEYFVSETYDDGVYYPYTCNDCSFEGQEHYGLTFVGHCEDNGTGEFLD